MKNQKGFSLIELLVVVIIIAVIAAIAIPSLLASRRAANEASAIAGLRTIHSGQATYLTTVAGGTYATTLALMGTANVIDDDLAAGNRNGYDFEISASPAATSTLFCAAAEATTQGSSGVRRFGINQDGVIHVNAAAAVTCANDASFTLTGTALDQ